MLEPNQIYERECTAGMKEIAPGSVDLAFADPPFNIGYDYDVYDDRARSRALPRLVAAVDRRRFTACSSRPARSGWRSATNTRPS